MTTIDHPPTDQAPTATTSRTWCCPVCGQAADESTLPCTSLPLADARARWPQLAQAEPDTTVDGVAFLDVCGDCAAPERPAPIVTERAATAQTAPAAYSAPNSSDSSASLEMPLAWIAPSTINPRTHFDAGELAELAASLRAHGMLEPIVVRPVDATMRLYGPPPYYTIIAGERRWRAAGVAEMDTVPVRVFVGIDDKKALELAIVENLQRVDLDPIEEAEGYRKLHDVVGLKQGQIAAAVKRSQPAIAKALGLLDLPEDVRTRIGARELTASHGVALARFKAFPKLQSRFAKWAAESGATTKELERGIPFEREAIDAGLIVRVDTYRAGFDTKVCETCPFDAYRKATQSYGHLCLNVAHYRELQAQGKREEEERTAAAIERAKAIAQPQERPPAAVGDDGARPAAPPRGDVATPETRPADLPLLQDIPWDKRKDLRGDRVPAGCSDACPCRSRALLSRGGPERIVSICIDPARYDELMAAEKRAEKAGARAAMKATLAAVDAHLQSLTDVGWEELVLLATVAINRGTKDVRVAAIERHAPALRAKAEQSYSITFDDLKSLARMELVGLAVDVVLRDELYRHHENGYNSSGTAYTTWYTGAIAARRQPTGQTAGGLDVFPCHDCGATIAPDEFQAHIRAVGRPRRSYCARHAAQAIISRADDESVSVVNAPADAEEG